MESSPPAGFLKQFPFVPLEFDEDLDSAPEVFIKGPRGGTRTQGYPLLGVSFGGLHAENRAKPRPWRGTHSTQPPPPPRGWGGGLAGTCPLQVTKLKKSLCSACGAN